MNALNHRVVSLVPSATEIVWALGLEHYLVGRSHECDYPESVLKLPPCTAPKFDVVGSSREIDDRVRELLCQGLSVYAVDENLLRELKPDVILTQSQCDVCAASLEEVQKAALTLLPSSPKVVSLEPCTLSDIWEDIQRVADALDASERGFELVEKLWSRVETVSNLARTLSAHPTVCCIEWMDPLMVAGNWIPDMVELTGGYYPYSESGQRSRVIEWSELRETDPDILVVAPCGFSLERSFQELSLLTNHPYWPTLKAVRSGRCFVADGNHYFNRPGPRIVDALEMLADMIFPEAQPQKRWFGIAYRRI